MNQIDKHLYRVLLSVLFCIMMEIVMAQPVITLTTIPGRCPTNGSISVTATGTIGTPLYAIKKLTDMTFSPEQTSNVFNNLNSSTYIVAVHDATGITISDPVTLTNSPYSVMSTSSIVSGNLLVTGCNPDGSIELNITGGRPPYTYHLRNGPTPKPDIVDTPGTRARFVQLETGNYFIDISDSCHNILTQSTPIIVRSLYNLKDTILASVDGLSGALQSGGSCIDSLAISTNNILLKSVNGTILFDRDGIHMPAGYPMQARVEYPAGSGNFSAWQSVFSKFELAGYSPDSTLNSYRIQLKHPCNDTNIVTSPAYTISFPYQSRSSFCSPTLVHTTTGYNCGAVNIHLVDINNSSNTRDYTWDGVGTSFSFDTTGWGNKTFKVFITIGGASYQTTKISAGAVSSVNVAADSWDFLSNLYCDFTTGRLRSYLTNFPADNAIPITYSIISGPESREPVTALLPLSEFIWDTLKAGPYSIKVDYGGCRSETINRTIILPYSGFGADELSYRPGTSCGRYIITGRGWYTTPLGDPLIDSLETDSLLGAATNVYCARFINSAGQLGQVSPNAISGVPFAMTSQEVLPGTYNIVFMSKHHSQNHCYYVQKTITIPPYVPVAIDVTASGGVACDSLTGDIYIGTVGGNIYISITGASIRPFSFRIKPRDSTDVSYTPWQSSPLFENKPVGVYTAQVFDSCGYTATSNVELLGLDTVSAINVTGTSAISTQGAVCEYDSISMQLSITGPASNVRWILPNSDTVNSNVYIISNFASSNAGKYYVVYTGGGCPRRDSVTLTFNLAPTYTAAGRGICKNTNIDLDSLVSNISPNSVFNFYGDPVALFGIGNPVVSPDSSTTYYVRSTDSLTGCKSLITALAVTVNYKPNIGTLVTPPPACAVQPLILTSPIVTPQGSAVTNQGWTLDGALFDPLTLLSVADNGRQLRYFVQSGCGDSTTAPVTITVNAKPAFAFNDPDTVLAPNTFDLTTLVLATGDTTGLTLTYYDSLFTPLSASQIAAAGEGTYYIIGSISAGCSDTSTIRVTVEDMGLPVGLLYFRTSRNGNDAILSWATSFEQNSNHFEIEQSTNGSQFNKIGEKPAAGNSSSNIDYYYRDVNILRYGAGRIYYRLRQVDNDGRAAYSGTRLLTLAGRSDDWKVYPVPFSNLLVIDIPNGIRGQVSIEISDMAGQVVYSKQELISTQLNMIMTGLPQLANGTYVLIINSNKGKKTMKIIKD